MPNSSSLFVAPDTAQPAGTSSIASNTTPSPRPVKVEVIEYDTSIRYKGRVKFYNEAKKYGFIVEDDTNKEIFTYGDAFEKAKISTQHLKEVKKDGGRKILVTFCKFHYLGNEKSEKVKAEDIQVISNTL
jgi:cold shock CspA family protein